MGAARLTFESVEHFVEHIAHDALHRVEHINRWSTQLHTKSNHITSNASNRSSASHQHHNDCEQSERNSALTCAIMRCNI
jgi:hypothetical protein